MIDSYTYTAWCTLQIIPTQIKVKIALDCFRNGAKQKTAITSCAYFPDKNMHAPGEDRTHDLKMTLSDYETDVLPTVNPQSLGVVRAITV